MAEPGKPQRPTSALVKRDGALCLTFVNTAAERRRSLGSYDDLVAWGLEHESLSSAEAARMRRLAADRLEDAVAAFGAAEELRAVLSRLFNAAVDGEEPPREAVDCLSAFLIHTVPPRQLVFSNGRYRLAWVAGREDDLSRPLWELALSATGVLTSGDCGRMVRCAGADCGVLFVARNSGSPRRWCAETCSHRARSLRRYHDTVKPYKAEIRRNAKDLLRKKRSSSE
jgi:predicted RNA-binding Zn ribbon-like protein